MASSSLHEECLQLAPNWRPLLLGALPTVEEVLKSASMSRLAQKILLERSHWLVNDAVLDDYVAQLVQLACNQHGNYVASRLWLLAPWQVRQRMLAVAAPHLGKLARHPQACRLVAVMMSSSSGATLLQWLVDDQPLASLAKHSFGTFVVQACVQHFGSHPLLQAMFPELLGVLTGEREQAGRHRDRCRAVVACALDLGHISQARLADAQLSKPELLRGYGVQRRIIREAFGLGPPAAPAAPAAPPAELEAWPSKLPKRLKKLVRAKLQRQAEQARAPAGESPEPSEPAAPPAPAPLDARPSLVSMPCVLYDAYGHWCYSTCCGYVFTTEPQGTLCSAATHLRWSVPMYRLRMFGGGQSCCALRIHEACGGSFQIILQSPLHKAWRKQRQSGPVPEVHLLLQLRGEGVGLLSVEMAGQRVRNDFRLNPNVILQRSFALPPGEDRDGLKMHFDVALQA